MKRKINYEVLLQLTILLGLAVLMLFALLSGRAQEYVHPRLNGFLWFSIAALFGISFFMLPSLFKPKHNANAAKYLIVLFPMITAIFLPTGTVQGKAITLGNLTTTVGQSSQPKGTVIPDKIISNDDVGIDCSSSSSPEPQVSKNGVTTITDEQFANWYSALNKDMNQYAGKTVRFKGQVFRMNDFAENEFVPARYAMTCCAADLEPCGVLCRNADAKSIKDKEWIWVTGTLKIEKYKDQTLPVCYVTKIEKAEKPKVEYIYFTY